MGFRIPAADVEILTALAEDLNCRKTTGTVELVGPMLLIGGLLITCYERNLQIVGAQDTTLDLDDPGSLDELDRILGPYLGLTGVATAATAATEDCTHD